MKKYYFTFGYGQIPGFGMYCVIEASSFERARNIMAKRTLKFSFQYTEEEFLPQIKQFSLKEVYWDKRCRGWSDHPVNER